MKLTNEADMNWSDACAARGGTNNTWRIPTKDEWPMIAGSLGIGSDYNSKFGLTDYCWSSTEVDSYDAWYASFFDSGMTYYFSKTNTFSVRLCTTF